MNSCESFTKGEKVFCYHGQMLYEAKILSTDNTSRRHKYMVHYMGWKKKWDELVTEHSVLKYNPTNVKLYETLAKKYGCKQKDDERKNKKSRRCHSESTTTKKVAKVSSSAVPSLVVNNDNPFRRSQRLLQVNRQDEVKTNKSARGRRHIPASNEDGGKSDDGINADTTRYSSENKENTESANGPHGIAAASTGPITDDNIPSCSTARVVFTFPSITLSHDLKLCLTVDWKNIIQDKKLFRLPAAVTIEDIIYKYLSTQTSSKNRIVINEVLLGVIEYINVTLGTQLLYAREREQYSQLLKDHPNTCASRLYGAYHLLRLFVNLGKMMRFSNLNKSSSENLIGHLHTFLAYLDKNRGIYFDETRYYKE